MIIRHGALVLVADGKKYLLLRNTGSAAHPRLTFESGGSQQNPATAKQGSDKPGRAFGSGPARSVMEQTDFHQIAEDRFAGQIAEWLGQLARAGDYDELVVVAPPRCLAELRDQFEPSVTRRIVAQLDKDLTNHPVDEVCRILVREP